jgi:hypothetical protein
MILRVLAALFGALIFGLAVPILWPLWFAVPFGNFTGVVVLAATGVIIGAILGVMFPRVFGFIFEVIFDI